MARAQPPKYLTIADDLRRQILGGDLAPSSRLPAQHQLAKSYDVTIMTLRQAMAELEAEGLIWVSRGRGSFVADHPLQYQVGNLTSFAQQMRAQGLRLDTKLLSVAPPQTALLDTSAPVDPVWSDAQEVLGATSPLMEIRRLRLVSERPVVLQRTLLSSAIGGELDLERLAHRSLYEMVEQAADYRVVRARESLRAVVLEADDAGVLEQPAGAPAMLSIRVSMTLDNTPFLYDRALLVGEAASVEADRQADRLALSYAVEL